MYRMSIVLGAGFGDEGKGSFVNRLCKEGKDNIVIRFNGGHQVGHTVVEKGMRHAFSNFGSGTLVGVPTYISEYCTVDPNGMYKESLALNELGITPKIYYNANAMITTPFDILGNINDSENTSHGSVGVGFGKTIERNEKHYHLFVRDLLYPVILNQKIELIINYYKLQNITFKNIGEKIANFLEKCEYLVKNSIIIDDLSYILNENSHLIFEGGQGIMLDMDYGFFPNVTRSNTTSKNAMAIIKKLRTAILPKIYYVTRAYQTRHGNGYMSNTDEDISYIKDNPNETNVYGLYQCEFRKSVLDLDLLKYAIDCDNYHNYCSEKRLVITCLDQVPDKFPMTLNDELIVDDYFRIGKECGIQRLSLSYSDEGCAHFNDVIVP